MERRPIYPPIIKYVKQGISWWGHYVISELIDDMDSASTANWPE